jgi:hypothetical protein
VQGHAFSLAGTVTDNSGTFPYHLGANYGDGSSGRVGGTQVSSFVVSHAYANAGTYTVVLTFNDDAGNEAQATFQVIVSGFTVNNGGPQPSPVTSLTYTFANPVLAKPGAFELLRNGHPSHIHLVLDEQPDQQNFLITFRGPGVIDGALPDGSYTLITLHKKVTVLSGPPMTQNDVNKFVSRSGDVRRGGKDIGSSKNRPTGRMEPPKKGPAKLPGRTVHHHGSGRPAWSPQHPARTRAVRTVDHLEGVAIAAPAPGKLHQH